MIKTIAVINQKGGVGKTSTACHLAYSFADQKKRTLLIDLDPSANATSIFLSPSAIELDKDPSLFLPKTVKDLLLAKDFPEECVYPAYEGDSWEALPFLKIIPSSIGLAMLEMNLGFKPFKEALLNRKIQDPYIQDGFDYIVIDCPPTLSLLTVNAIYASNVILIPVNYQKNALEGVADLFDVLSEVKAQHIYNIFILRNQYDLRTTIANNYINQKINSFVPEDLLLNTIIREDEMVNRATIENHTVFSYCSKSPARKDYLLLRAELEELLNGRN